MPSFDIVSEANLVEVRNALDQANIESIARIQLKALEARLAKMDMQLEVSPAALAEIAKAGFDERIYVRPQAVGRRRGE